MARPSASIMAGRLLLGAVTMLSVPAVALAGSGVPDYPSAKVNSTSPNGHSAKTCGRTISLERSLAVDADPHTIAKWYRSKLPGSSIVDTDTGDDSGGGLAEMTALAVIPADGTHFIFVQSMSFNGARAKSGGAMLGLDKATIFIERVVPPFPPGYAKLTAQAASGGAKGAAAKQQLTAACK